MTRLLLALLAVCCAEAALQVGTGIADVTGPVADINFMVRRCVTSLALRDTPPPEERVADTATGRPFFRRVLRVAPSPGQPFVAAGCVQRVPLIRLSYT